MAIDPVTFEKRADPWSRTYDVDFWDFSEISGEGQRIVSAALAGGAGLTLGPPVLNDAGTVVQFTVGGGTPGTTYSFDVVATFSGGAVVPYPVQVTVLA